MSDGPEMRGAHLMGAVADARTALLEWVDEAADAGRKFLEVQVLRIAQGRYRLRHALDAAVAVDELNRHTDPIDAREIAQTTESGAHRPLKTAPSLKRGWTFESLDERALYLALNYIYPACVAHWFAGLSGSLRPTHWRETAARQSGIYSAVGLLSEAAVRDTVKACCGDAVCLRDVAWGLDSDATEPLDDDFDGVLGASVADPGDARVPCPEACSMFISFARSVLAVERTAPREVEGLGSIREAEIAQLRDLALTAAGGTMDEIREGDFEHPANRRRVRYLATKLVGNDAAE